MTAVQSTAAARRRPSWPGRTAPCPRDGPRRPPPADDAAGRGQAGAAGRRVDDRRHRAQRRSGLGGYPSLAQALVLRRRRLPVGDPARPRAADGARGRSRGRLTMPARARRRARLRPHPRPVLRHRHAVLRRGDHARAQQRRRLARAARAAGRSAWASRPRHTAAARRLGAGSASPSFYVLARHAPRAPGCGASARTRTWRTTSACRRPGSS